MEVGRSTGVPLPPAHPLGSRVEVRRTTTSRHQAAKWCRRRIWRGRQLEAGGTLSGSQVDARHSDLAAKWQLLEVADTPLRNVRPLGGQVEKEEGVAGQPGGSSFSGWRAAAPSVL